MAFNYSGWRVRSVCGLWVLAWAATVLADGILVPGAYQAKVQIPKPSSIVQVNRPFAERENHAGMRELPSLELLGNQGHAHRRGKPGTAQARKSAGAGYAR
jgi:hypothetical protein